MPQRENRPPTQRGAKRNYTATAPSARSKRTDPARVLAFNVISKVTHNDAYANLVLPGAIREARLNKQDAAFATELTYGTLRALGTYDAILAQNVDRPLEKLDTSVLNTLRVGAHQLLAMRVPTHAALNETVALAKMVAGQGSAGLVNAVLRKVSAKTLEEWTSQLSETLSDPHEMLAVKYAHPAWVVRALSQSLKARGKEDELEQLLEADNLAPVVNLIALPGLADISEMVELGATPGELVADSATLRDGDPSRFAPLKTGATRVQDVGSQLVARALAQAPLAPGAAQDPAQDPAQDAAQEQWLDMCAGPGGKASLLAALAAEAGHHLQANEPTAHRAELVRKALHPVPEQNWEVSEHDGRDFATLAPASFHRIMIDAPCTGLGALRRRPESRWRRTPSDVGTLSKLQGELLASGLTALKPGGVLAYVTCSPHVAETEHVVDAVLAKHPEAESLTRVDTPEIMDQVALVEELGSGPGSSAQLWPHQHHTDAMYMALIQKAAQ